MTYGSVGWALNKEKEIQNECRNSLRQMCSLGWIKLVINVKGEVYV